MSKIRHYVVSIIFHKDTWLCLVLSFTLSLLIARLALWRASYSYNYSVTTHFFHTPFRLYFWGYFFALIISYVTGYLLAKKNLLRFFCAIYMLFGNISIKSRAKKCIAKLIKKPFAMLFTYHLIPIFLIITFVLVPLTIIFLVSVMKLKHGMPISVPVCYWVFILYILASISMYFSGYLRGKVVEKERLILIFILFIFSISLFIVLILAFSCIDALAVYCGGNGVLW